MDFAVVTLSPLIPGPPLDVASRVLDTARTVQRFAAFLGVCVSTLLDAECFAPVIRVEPVLCVSPL